MDGHIPAALHLSDADCVRAEADVAERRLSEARNGARFYAACWVALNRMRFGRYVYVIGGNEDVARLAGIQVGTIKIAVYALSGMLASVAGIIITSRLESAQPTAGTSYELDAIAAVVVGGTSLAGGKGSLFGTLVGALIIGVLSNAFNLMNVSSYYQMIAKGAVILLAVLVDMRGRSVS